MKPSAWRPSRRTCWMVGLFVLALALRLVFLFQLRASSPTFEAPEGGDSILYDRLASGESGPARAYFHSPLYVWFLTGAYQAFGRDLTAVRCIQHGFGALTAVLLFALTHRLFRRESTAILAGLLYAGFGPGVLYEGQLLVDGLMPGLMVFAALLALRADGSRPNFWSVAAGVAVGLAALGRAIALSWLPLLAIWQSRPLRRKGSALRIALILGGAALVVTPVTLRNWVVERDFVLITANGGLNMYVGNQPGANGAYVLPPGLWFEPGDPRADYSGFGAASEDAGRPLASSEVSAWWTARALSYVRSEPVAAAALALRKLRLLITDYECPQLHDYGSYREVTPILGGLLTAGFLTAPGIVGLILMLRPASARRQKLYVTLVAGHMVSFLPFFVVGRLRTALVALLAPAAAHAVMSFLVAVHRRTAVPAMAIAAAALGFSSLVLSADGLPSGTAPQMVEFARGARALGDDRRAAYWAERAIAVDPRSSAAIAIWADALTRHGRSADALELLTVERTPSRDPAVLVAIGRIQLAESRLPEAIRTLRSAIDLAPGDAGAWQTLGQALDESGAESAAARTRMSALMVARAQRRSGEDARTRFP